MTASSATIHDDPQPKIEASRFAEIQMLFSENGEPKVKLEEKMEEMRLEAAKLEMWVALQYLLHKPIKFNDDEEETESNSSNLTKDKKKFDQLMEEVMKKNEQLQHLSQSIMSDQVKATQEVSNITLGLQKNFRDALSYFDTYAKRIEKTVKHREENRKAYLTELETIRDNFVKNRKEDHQKHKELTKELLQDTHDILQHPCFHDFEEKLERIERSLSSL